MNFHSYGVEKSWNGKDYTVIGEIPATNSPFYQYTDAAVDCPVAYYRLRFEDLDGNNTYSPIVVINAQRVSGIRVMPNPVEDQLTLGRSNHFTEEALTGTDRELYPHPAKSGKRSNDQLQIIL